MFPLLPPELDVRNVEDPPVLLVNVQAPAAYVYPDTHVGGFVSLAVVPVHVFLSADRVYPDGHVGDGAVSVSVSEDDEYPGDCPTSSSVAEYPRSAAAFAEAI